MELNMRYTPIVIATCLLLSACSSMSMGEVVRVCDTGKEFSNYASCIRTTYDKHGDAKNSTSVRAFYAYIDKISSAYKDGDMTREQAMEALYKAYNKTVVSAEAGNGV